MDAVEVQDAGGRQRHQLPRGRRPSVRLRARHAARDAFDAGLALTAARRPLPDLVVFGAQRSGTTNLMYSLLRPGNVIGPRHGKGAHFLSFNWWRGEAWYRAQFPTSHRRDQLGRKLGFRPLTAEASPYYLFHPLAAERLGTLMPHATVLVMLRDPVTRAISQYQHEAARGFEDLPLEEALDREAERLGGEEARICADHRYRGYDHEHHSYVARGRYAEQLQRLFAHVDRDRVLVLQSEAYYADTAGHLEQVCRHIGIPPVRPDGSSRNGYRYERPAGPLVERLAREFEPHNEALFELLGRRFDWTRP